MSALSPKEFRLFIKTITEEYKDSDCVEQEDNYFKELYDDLKRENQLLKKSVEKLTKENMQLHFKYKQKELDEQKIKEVNQKEKVKEVVNQKEKVKEKEVVKEVVKIDSAYFRKRLNL